MPNLETQKSAKPNIYDVINDFLDGEKQTRALEFIAYLKENKLTPQWTNINTWKTVSKGKSICYIKIGVERDSGASCYPKLTENSSSADGCWVINPSVTGFDNYFINPAGYEDLLSDKNKFDIIKSKVRSCINCGNKKNCAPGRDINFWGEELHNRCKFFAVPFLDPNPEELECVKNLVEHYRKSIMR